MADDPYTIGEPWRLLTGADPGTVVRWEPIDVDTARLIVTDAGGGTRSWILSADQDDPDGDGVLPVSLSWSLNRDLWSDRCALAARLQLKLFALAGEQVCPMGRVEWCVGCWDWTVQGQG